MVDGLAAIESGHIAVRATFIYADSELRRSSSMLSIKPAFQRLAAQA